MLHQANQGAEANLGPYRVQLAQSAADMAQVMALRRAGFGAGQDAYDAASMQIMVLQDGDLAATFRLRAHSGAAAAQLGYTGQFYDLRALTAMTRPLLELGRFCLASHAVQVDALRLSFAAMAAQVDRLGAGLLFGCASFQGRDLAVHRAPLSLLKRHISLDWPIGCLAGDPIDVQSLSHQPSEEAAALRAQPPLLRSYLALGGWVGGQAVRDDDLGTFHVFTALEVARIPAARAAALRGLAAQMGEM